MFSVKKDSKILSILMAAIMVLSMVGMMAVPASAAEVPIGLSAPGNPHWDGDTGIAVWDNVPNSGSPGRVSYSLRLYRKDTPTPPSANESGYIASSSASSNGTNLQFYYNFSNELKENGYYYFTVSTISDSMNYSPSPYTVSENYFHYTKPVEKLPTPVGLEWKLDRSQVYCAYFSNLDAYSNTDSFTATCYNKAGDILGRNTWTKANIVTHGNVGIQLSHASVSGEYRFTVQALSARSSDYQASEVSDFSPWLVINSQPNIPVTSDPIPFADPNFKQALLDLGLGTDGEITVAEAASITTLDVSQKGITSLAGIEYFTNLRVLTCYGNELTELNVSNNTALTSLNCGQWDNNTGRVLGNNLTTLDLSKNVALERLQCRGNQLTSLDTSHNPNLQVLYCSENEQLGSLNLSQNPLLTELHCTGGALTSLDVTHNPILSYINCSNSGLTSLDLSQNPELQYLYCNSNPFMGTTLDLSKNVKLIRAFCGNMGLLSLDVSQNTALEELHCYGNELTSLDVSQNPALTYLNCGYNVLTALNLKNGALEYIDCQENLLTGLDVTGLNALEILICKNNSMTSEASVAGLDKNVTTTFLFNPQDSGNVAADLEYLNDLTKETATAGQILDALDDLGNQLVDALHDKDATAIITAVEAAYKAKAGINVLTPTVAPNAPAYLQNNASQIGIVGAAFNAERGEELGLHLSTPATEAPVDTTKYDTSNMIQMDITLDGEVDHSDLDYPVAITIPIPPSIHPTQLRILHYNKSGEAEVIRPVLNGDGTCTFTVTHFSTFAFVSEVATNTESNTGSSSSSSSSGSGGGGSAATVSNAPAPVTKANAVSLTKKAITDAAKNGTSAVVKFENASALSLANIKAMIAAAGKTAFTIQADSLAKNGKAVDVRIAFDPAKSAKDLNLSASTWNARAVNTKSFFGSFYSNSLMVASLGQQGAFGQSVKIAVKLDASLKKDNLVFYAYDKATNIYKKISKPNYVVDANGYVHFTTELAGDIIISDGALAKK